MISRKNIVIHMFLVITLILACYLFFYNLGSSSLVSWDEAWYGAIAKNIIKTGDVFNMHFNSSRFADHPPAGFWLMAISMKLLGITEFGVRFASALTGLLSLLFVFLIGTEIASPAVGIASAITLLSSPWFTTRARSGNLDIPLTFFFILTFYLAIKAAKNRRLLIPFGLSLAFLFLTKTMVPFTIFPALLIIFWGSKHKAVDYLQACIAFLFLPAIWVISQLVNFPHFIDRYFSIGLPTTQIQTTLKENFTQLKVYLHSGIGTIFRPVLISLPFSIFLLKNKYILALVVFSGSFLIPFTLSSRSQIWHMIPVYPFLILLCFSIPYLIVKFLFKNHISLSSAVIITLAIVISTPQIAKNWYEFINVPKFVSDEAILSTEAKKYPYPLTIDDRFLPSAVYYSDKYVNYPETEFLTPLFSKNENLLLITRQWRLDAEKIPPAGYRILKKDRDMILLLIPKSE